jgi:quercetin dioxygenase-like cupin family protein
MKLKHVIVAVGLASAAAGGGVAFATEDHGAMSTPVASAQLARINANVAIMGGRIKIHTSGRQDIIIRQFTLAPGGDTGWHSHAGPVIDVVTQGTLTTFFADDLYCRPHTLTAGHASFDGKPAVPRIAFNKGNTPVVFYGIFFVPHGRADPRVDMPFPPGNCPF